MGDFFVKRSAYAALAYGSEEVFFLNASQALRPGLHNAALAGWIIAAQTFLSSQTAYFSINEDDRSL